MVEVVDWEVNARDNQAIHPTGPRGVRATRISLSFQEMQAAIARWRDTLGGGSPLTTKGDLFTYSTVDARLPVGTNGQVLSADSAEVTGLKWIANSSLPAGTTTSAALRWSGSAWEEEPNFQIGVNGELLRFGSIGDVDMKNNTASNVAFTSSNTSLTMQLITSSGNAYRINSGANFSISDGQNGDIVLNYAKNAAVSLYYNDVESARTGNAAAGGFQVNNTLTGAGFERVLTTSDLGAYLGTTYITTTNSAWAPNSKTARIKFTAIGGGGGAGGINGVTSADGTSGGGAGGSACIKETTTIDATYNITIGAGGSGGAAGNNNGTKGGDTTVVGSVGPGTNVNMNATGGRYGDGYDGSSGNSYRTANEATEFDTPSGGDLLISGVGAGAVPTVGGVNAGGGTSGYCPLIGGGVEVSSNATGVTATFYGEGGGAARSGTATNYAGGDGFQGIVIIEEWA